MATDMFKTGKEMMRNAMTARIAGYPAEAAFIYAVAGDAFEAAAGWHLDTHAGLARYWERECSTHPLRRGVCPTSSGVIAETRRLHGLEAA